MKLSELENRFAFHEPDSLKIDKYNGIREQARYFAEVILELTPDSREQSLAITKLEEVMFWANAAIARH